MSELAVGMPAPLWEDTLEARVVDLLRRGETITLVTIVRSAGSAPRHAGTRALCTAAGFEGTVGGGALEARAMEAARQCRESGLSALVRCDLSGVGPDSDMICGGNMEVLCEVLTPQAAELFDLAAAALREDNRGAWLVDVSEPSLPRRQLWVEALPQDHALPPQVLADADAARALLEACGRKPGLVTRAGRSVYVEPLSAPPVLLLCGGGHVSLEVARLAQVCGFVVDVADDRPQFANAERFPMARHCHVLPEFADLVETCNVGRRHYVAIVTRGHSFDREVLAQALTSHARYIGMIGSKSKKTQVYAALRAQGVPDAELAAVCCPIGLPVAAETPQQIAVSIVAELLAVRAGTLQRLRLEE